MKNHSKRLLGTSIDVRHYMVPGLDLTANNPSPPPTGEDLFITEYLINQQHKKRICKLVRLKDCLWRGKHRESGWRQEDCLVPGECWRVVVQWQEASGTLTISCATSRTLCHSLTTGLPTNRLHAFITNELFPFLTIVRKWSQLLDTVVLLCWVYYFWYSQNESEIKN